MDQRSALILHAIKGLLIVVCFLCLYELPRKEGGALIQHPSPAAAQDLNNNQQKKKMKINKVKVPDRDLSLPSIKIIP